MAPRRARATAGRRDLSLAPARTVAGRGGTARHPGAVLWRTRSASREISCLRSACVQGCAGPAARPRSPAARVLLPAATDLGGNRPPHERTRGDRVETVDQDASDDPE